MSSSVRIVTDSSCDLPAEQLAAARIEVVPLSIRFGTEEFPDSRTLPPTEFWARCASSPTLPETAAPSPGAFVECFRQLKAEGASEVVCINISRKLSGTIQSAEVAAEEVAAEIKVHVVDSHTVSMGLGFLCLNAAQSAAAGASADDIVRAVEAQRSKIRVIAALDTLDNLKKGGRIGTAQAMLGSLLSIKPIIEIRDGIVEAEGRQRTRSKALDYLLEQVRAAGPLARAGVVHGHAADVDEFAARLSQLIGADVTVAEVGAVIGTHGGPRLTGVIFEDPR